MKKLVATTALALALTACSQATESEPTQPVQTTDTPEVTESEDTESEDTEPDESESEEVEPEPTEDSEETEPAALAPEGVTIDTVGLVTTIQGSADALTVTYSYPGKDPITVPEFSAPGGSEELALAHVRAADGGCATGPVVYTPWEGTCEASDDFVHAFHALTDHSPLANPSTVAITITPDLPDGQQDVPVSVRYTQATKGDTSYRIDDSRMGELYYAILTLLTTEPSNEVCDTAAGATLSLTHGPDGLYEGNFGICQLEAADYVAFNTINDIVTEAIETGEQSTPVQ